LNLGQKNSSSRTDTVIILPDQKLSEPVRLPDWISARVHLIEKGLVSEGELDKLLVQNAPPPKTSSAKKKES
jgi:hypothetical protein